MITLDDLKEKYIDNVLSSTGLNFQIFIDTGDYRSAERYKNTTTEYINGLLKLASSEIKKIGSMSAVAMQVRLSFLVPVPDEEDTAIANDGGFSAIANFRNKLSEAFGQNTMLSITDSDDKTYTGGVVYTFPMSGARRINSLIGDSIEYICTITFAYLKNALNSSNIEFAYSSDGETYENIPITSFNFTAHPNVVSNLTSNNANGVANAYSESANFNIDIETPCLTNTAFSIAVKNNILGITSHNNKIYIKITENEGQTALVLGTYEMLLGQCSMVGSGINNVNYSVSFIPYLSENIEDGA